MEAVECAIIHESIGDMNLHLAFEIRDSGEEESDDDDDDESAVPLWT